jgi:hypothetical protein
MSNEDFCRAADRRAREIVKYSSTACGARGSAQILIDLDQLVFGRADGDEAQNRQVASSNDHDDPLLRRGRQPLQVAKDSQVAVVPARDEVRSQVAVVAVDLEEADGIGAVLFANEIRCVHTQQLLAKGQIERCSLLAIVETSIALPPNLVGFGELFLSRLQFSAGEIDEQCVSFGVDGMEARVIESLGQAETQLIHLALRQLLGVTAVGRVLLVQRGLAIARHLDCDLRRPVPGQQGDDLLDLALTIWRGHINAMLALVNVAVGIVEVEGSKEENLRLGRAFVQRIPCRVAALWCCPCRRCKAAGERKEDKLPHGSGA